MRFQLKAEEEDNGTERSPSSVVLKCCLPGECMEIKVCKTAKVFLQHYTS